jgi:hypothetical protein
MHRTSMRNSHDISPLQEINAPPTMQSSANINRTTTQDSHDVPSLKDPGGLLSSTS